MYTKDLAMFIATKTDFNISETTDGWLASAALDQPGSKTKIETFELNDSAIKLVRFLTQENETEKVVPGFCSEYDIDTDENKEWIVHFLQGILHYGIAELTEEPRPFEVKINTNITQQTPSNVTIEITNTCNENCAHCYLCAGPGQKDSLPFERFISLCDELADAGVLMVEITGGEVFMHPHAYQMLEHAFKKFVQVALLTNGTILTDNVLDLLKEHKDNVVVSISIDSVRAETHNLFRRHRRAFEKTTANVRKLTAAGVPVRISSAIWEGNKWELEDLCHLARDLGAFAFSFSFIEGFGRGEDFKANHGHAETDEFNKLVQKVLTENEDLIPTLTNNDVATPLNCGATKGSITISPNGTLRPCNLFPQDFNLGSVLTEGSWVQQFRNDEIQKMQQIPSPSIKHGCDERCPNRSYCGGCYLKGLQSNLNVPEHKMCSWVSANELEWAVKKLAACNA